MKWQNVLPLIVVLVLARPTVAGLIFGSKKPVKPPNERVAELVATLKGDGDENKRYDAAENLRQFDPVQFPQIIPALIEALFNDPKPSVRSEVAQTLGKLRPINPMVGQALEQAHKKDPSMRVRIQAGSSLMSYRWYGYQDGKSGVIESKEPPTSAPKTNPQPVPIKISPVPQPTPTANNIPPVPATPQPKRSWWGFGSSSKPPPAPANPAGPRTSPAQSAEPPLAPPVRPSPDTTTMPLPSSLPGEKPVLAPPKLEPIPESVPPPPQIVLPAKPPAQAPLIDTGPDLPPQN